MEKGEFKGQGERDMSTLLPVRSLLLLSLALHVFGTTSCILCGISKTSASELLQPDTELLFPGETQKMTQFITN